MKKLITLLMLVTCGIGMGWAAGPTDPSDKEISLLTVTTTTLYWTTGDNANTWEWCVSGVKSDRTSFTIANKSYSINPETDKTCDLTSCSALTLKANNDKKTVYMYVNGIKQLDAYFINPSSDKTAAARTPQINIKPKNGNYTKYSIDINSGESAKKSVEGLDPSVTYLIKFDSSKDDVNLYAVRFYAASTTDPVLSATSNISLLSRPL